MICQSNALSTNQSEDVCHSKGKQALLPSLIAFVVALLASFWQNMHPEHLGTMFLFDSGHYFETCRQFGLWLQALASTSQGHAPSPVFTNYIMLDGPVLPAAAAFVFAFLGKVPSIADWQIFVVIESFFHAFSAGLVALLAAKFTQRRSLALVSGLLFALYPPAIFACGHILQEPLAACFLLAFLLALSKFIAAGNGRASAFFAGLCAALVFLTKPALIFALSLSYVCALFYLSGISKKARLLLLTFLGAVIVLMPWLYFTRQATGQVHIAPEREQTYNMAKGINLEMDGFGTYPIDTFCRLFPESTGALACFEGVWANFPVGSANLSVRKVERLWGMPWNDFRNRFLGFGPQAILWWHRVILFLGILGGFLFLLRLRASESTEQSFVGVASLAVIFGHLAYVPFEAIPRYGFTAMPEFILLAVYLLSLALMAKSVPGFARDFGKAFCLAILLVACLVLCPNKLDLHEWACPLKTGQAARRKVDVSLACVKARPRWALVLVDGDKWSLGARLYFNGKSLPDLGSVYQYFPKAYDLRSVIDVTASALGKSSADMRQWRVAAVPLDLISLNGNNEIRLEPGRFGKATVYGDSGLIGDRRRHLLSFNYFSHARLFCAQDGLESRLVDPISYKRAESHCYFESAGKANSNDLSPLFGVQKGDYRLFLILGFDGGVKGDIPVKQDARPDLCGERFMVF